MCAGLTCCLLVGIDASGEEVVAPNFKSLKHFFTFYFHYCQNFTILGSKRTMAALREGCKSRKRVASDSSSSDDGQSDNAHVQLSAIASLSSEPEAAVHHMGNAKCTLKEDLEDAFTIIDNTRMAAHLKKAHLEMNLKDMYGPAAVALFAEINLWDSDAKQWTRPTEVPDWQSVRQRLTVARNDSEPLLSPRPTNAARAATPPTQRKTTLAAADGIGSTQPVTTEMKVTYQVMTCWKRVYLARKFYVEAMLTPAEMLQFIPGIAPGSVTLTPHVVLPPAYPNTRPYLLGDDDYAGTDDVDVNAIRRFVQTARTARKAVEGPLGREKIVLTSFQGARYHDNILHIPVREIAPNEVPYTLQV